MISAESYKQACGPEADVRAVCERVSHLWMCEKWECLLLGYTMVSQMNAVFHVAATTPMSRMQVGIAYKKQPFDVGEFIKRVEERIQG